MFSHEAITAFLLLFWASLFINLAFYFFVPKLFPHKKTSFFASFTLFVSSVGILAYLIADHYTGVGINDAAFSQIRHGMKGLRWQMWLPLVGACLAVFLLVFILSIRIHKKISLYPYRDISKRRAAVFFTLCLSVMLINPGFLQSGTLLYKAWSAQKHIESVMLHSKYPALPPPDVKPLSAVYIYAEGLEATFMNEKIFPNLTPRLNRLSEKAVTIHGIKQVGFTGWTIAGQIASNCGFPGMEGDSAFANDAARWPCASDFLAKEGYRMVYMNGSSLEFSGKGDFWKARGYSEVFGDKSVSDLAQTPDAPFSTWGAYDDTLFKAAWNKYTALLKSDKPFVLTLLTVDTHAPKGMGTPSCKNMPKYRHYENSSLVQSVHCADRTIGDFLEKLLADLPPHVIVVLQSDHLQTPRADIFPVLRQYEKERENLFMAWGANIEPKKIMRSATMFDTGATFLSLLGRDPQFLNLGRDLLSEQKTLVEEHGFPWMEERMRLALLDDRMQGAQEIEELRQKEAHYDE